MTYCFNPTFSSVVVFQNGWKREELERRFTDTVCYTVVYVMHGTQLLSPLPKFVRTVRTANNNTVCPWHVA